MNIMNDNKTHDIKFNILNSKYMREESASYRNVDHIIKNIFLFLIGFAVNRIVNTNKY